MDPASPLYGKVERITPDVKPGDTYEFLTDMETRAGHTHKKGSRLKVVDSTRRCFHGELSASGTNWLCTTIYGTSEWATLEQCISRGLFLKVSP